MNENKTNINWYPGHMAKTRREIKEKIDLIDIKMEKNIKKRYFLAGIW